MSPQVKHKVSGTGWLCFWSTKFNDWIPVVKLTPQQLSTPWFQISEIKFDEIQDREVRIALQTLS